MTQRDAVPPLIERAQAGDRAAFAELAAKYWDPLESWIDARLGERLRAAIGVEDVIQETMLIALRSVGSFRWQGDESFVRWLGGIAENVIRKTAEKTARRPRLRLTVDPAASDDSPGRAMRRKERFERLERTIADLPPDYREVIRLARIEGLKHEEIAARMGRSHAAVRQLVVRALRTLRERFGDTGSL